MDQPSNRPRVFVSSTINDLRDLRSALKYWLEEMGLEARMSEFNDFERRPEQGTFDSCFTAIADCDYYILLIGSRKGSVYEGDVSVTQQEYRTAAALAKQGKTKPVIFVRAEVLTALDERAALLANGIEPETAGSSPSRALKDPDFLRSFVEEVRRTEVERVGSAPSGAMWTYPFTDFHDLVDALRVNLRLQRSIRRQALLANLKWELLENISLVCYKSKGVPDPLHASIQSIRRSINVAARGVGAEFALTRAQAGRLAIFWMALGRARSLRVVALQEAVSSGEFLVYQQDTGQLVGGQAYLAMQSLLSATDSCRSLVEILRSPQRMAGYYAIFGAVRNREEPITANEHDLIFLFSLHDVLEDVIRLSVALLEYIAHPDAGLQMPPLNPTTPIAESVQSIEEERATHADIDEWTATSYTRWLLTGTGSYTQSDVENAMNRYPEHFLTLLSALKGSDAKSKPIQ